MHNQAAMLYKLQQIDLDIARRRTRLKAIDEQLSSDETIANATKQLNQAEQALKPWQTRARDLDLEIKSVSEKVQTTDADLYSGRITSPKALQELQDEIAALKRRQHQLEDELLEAMVEVDEHQGQLNAAQNDLAAARENLASTQSDLLDEQIQLEADNVAAAGLRQQAADAVTPDNLATYEKLRPRMRGVVIAVLQGESCSVCNIGQNATVIRRVHSQDIAYCASCGRILADIS